MPRHGCQLSHLSVTTAVVEPASHLNICDMFSRCTELRGSFPILQVHRAFKSSWDSKEVCLLRADASSIRVELREDAPEGGIRAVVGVGELQLDESLWNQQPLRQTLALKAADGEQVRVSCTACRSWSGESLSPAHAKLPTGIEQRHTGQFHRNSPNVTMPIDTQYRGQPLPEQWRWIESMVCVWLHLRRFDPL